MKKNHFVAFILAAIIPIIIVVTLLLTYSKIDDKDVSQGGSYLASLDKLDAESVEDSIRNESATTNNNFVETTPDGTEPSIPSSGDISSDTTETPIEPETSAPAFEHENPLCYVPYYVDANAATVSYNRFINGEVGMREFFAETAFVGDSVMTGFNAYFDMPENVNVFASVGATMKTHLPEVINSIISARPKNILIRYGLNEMTDDEYVIKVFMETYKMYISQLKEALPNSKIIIIGIPPVGQAAIDRESRFGNYARYNAGFRAICEEINVGYYENADLFYANQDKMSKDGVHFQKSL